jgi:hypothetical protein
MTIETRLREIRERALMLDTTLEDSFPASDPPSWMPGMARVAPADEISEREEDTWRNK